MPSLLFFHFLFKLFLLAFQSLAALFDALLLLLTPFLLFLLAEFVTLLFVDITLVVPTAEFVLNIAFDADIALFHGRGSLLRWLKTTMRGDRRNMRCMMLLSFPMPPNNQPIHGMERRNGMPHAFSTTLSCM